MVNDAGEGAMQALTAKAGRNASKARANSMLIRTCLFRERRAADQLCGVLEWHGLAPERAACDLETSFRCNFGEARPLIAILSEEDALPELGHAGGHDLVAAMVAATKHLRKTGRCHNGPTTSLAFSTLSGLKGRWCWGRHSAALSLRLSPSPIPNACPSLS